VIAQLAMLVNFQTPFLACPSNMENANPVGRLKQGNAKVCKLYLVTLYHSFACVIKSDKVLLIMFLSGHFGFIELPIPIYHPSHVSELKKMLGLVCLKCLKIKKNKV
jgi:hypothetical protein